MNKLRYWIPLYVLAGCAGVLVAKYKPRRAAAVRVAPVAGAPAAPRPDMRSVVPPRVMPADIEPAPVRARAIDLTVYSKFNFVARRLLDVPSTSRSIPGELLHWSEPIPDSPAPVRLGAFCLMFPSPDAVETIAGPVFYTSKELAMAVFAETRGLFPSRAAPGSVYNPRVWEAGFGPGAFGDLTLARRMIAETRKRNKRTHLAYFPSTTDKPSLISWYCCAEAAEDAVGARLYPLPPGMNLHFFIRQKEVGRQKPPYLAAREPVMSFGPFVNVGGGDVPRGGETYIDFYVLPSLRR